VSVKVESKIPQFKRETESKLEMILGTLASKIHTLAVMKAPKSKNIMTGGKKHSSPGNLRASGHSERVNKLSYRVSFGDKLNVPYARFQEYGGDGTRIVKRYTTPGTSKNYLRGSAENILRNANETLRKLL